MRRPPGRLGSTLVQIQGDACVIIRYHRLQTTPPPRMLALSDRATMKPLTTYAFLLSIALASSGAAEEATSTPAVSAVSTQTFAETGVIEEHPLVPVLQMAEDGLAKLTNDVQDYTCQIVRRERLGGKMRSYDFIRAKIRHAQPATEERNAVPFSVYLKFSKPKKVAGREVLYLEGRNAGKMLVRNGGTRLSYVTTYLAPKSEMAMKENRYPITDIGIRRLIARLIEVIKEDLQHGECKVRFYSNAEVGGRVCTRIVVEHPKRRDHFRFHRAIVFIDDERQIPLGYASYTWPKAPADKPILMEEYIYAKVKLNVGLTDEDFDRENSDYGFLREKRELE